MVRLSKEEARALGLAPAASKYNNDKPTYYDPDLKESLKFDSVKERDYYLIFKFKQKRGEISDLRRQVPYEIQPAFTDISGVEHKPITYLADFVYKDSENVEHIVDVKGFKTDVYKLKKKLLAYRGIIIEEV
jgi:hypothetical protein